MKKNLTCQNYPHLGIPSATSSESWEAHTQDRKRSRNPYFLDYLDFGAQLFLCPWGFLNHLRGTADRFLLAPACALPGIREYSRWSLVVWTITSEAGHHRLAPAPAGPLHFTQGLGSLQPGLRLRRRSSRHLGSDGQIQPSFRVRLWSHFVHLLIDSTDVPGMGLETKNTAGITGLKFTFPQQTSASVSISDLG